MGLVMVGVAIMGCGMVTTSGLAMAGGLVVTVVNHQGMVVEWEEREAIEGLAMVAIIDHQVMMRGEGPVMVSDQDCTLLFNSIP